MSIRMNAAMLKSNESTIHPRKTAQNARHCTRVTSRSETSAVTTTGTERAAETAGGGVIDGDTTGNRKQESGIRAGPGHVGRVLSDPASGIRDQG